MDFLCRLSGDKTAAYKLLKLDFTYCYHHWWRKTFIMMAKMILVYWRNIRVMRSGLMVPAGRKTTTGFLNRGENHCGVEHTNQGRKLYKLSYDI